MTHEIRFRRLLRSMLARGIKPTPTVINRYLGRTTRRKINSINGREAQWRRDELIAAGWNEPYYAGVGSLVANEWSPPS